MIGQSPSFSVSEFVAVFNQSLEITFPYVAVTGEIANFRVSKNMWVYFDLKDEYSSVRFFGSVYSLPGPLEDGIACEVFGRPRLHQQFGFSINFDLVKPVGEGSIRKAQDLLKKKLEAEGLFAPERKRPLPYPPVRIGLVTSAESAAIADFKKIIKARWPVLNIELIDTLVQGAQAPAAIVGAIQAFNLESSPPDVLVVIRGGGSTDDLAAFSDESVVRAVASSRIPTMVAIGHENDISLAELAADRRASTPSNAAELLVPDAVFERDLARRLGSEFDASLARRFEAELGLIEQAENVMKVALKEIFAEESGHISSRRVLLNALDPKMPLRQGYALIRRPDGSHVRRVSDMEPGGVFSVELTDGKKNVQALKGE